MMEPKSIYEFGRFRLDREARLLLSNGKTVPLTRKVLDLLLVLVENRGQLLAKDDLMKAVWPDTFVEEGNLTSNISILRKELGAPPGGGEYIETIPKRGYRFVGVVTEVQNGASSAAAPAPKPAVRSRVLLAASGIVLGSLLVLYLTGWFPKLPGLYAPTRIEALAVLPLENLSGDRAQDYFADGMTEALTTDLGKVGSLQVISRSAVMRYKGTRKPVAEIAKELKVDAVVEGSVLRSGDRVRITAHLVHSATNRQLWTESYERDVRDIVGLQSEVARSIAGEVRVKLTPQERARLTKAGTVNPEAYDHYLRAKFIAGRLNKADNETAIERLERAVAIDPTFAGAHAALARTYADRFFYLAPEEQKQLEVKAYAAVEKALSIDSDLAEAYLARARLLWTPANHFPHERTIQEFRRALALNPNSEEAHTGLARGYSHIGLLDEGLQEARKASAISPSDAFPLFYTAVALVFQGKYKQALDVWLSVPREVLPSVVEANTAYSLFQLGREGDARNRLEEFSSHPSEDTGGVVAGMQALVFAATGAERNAEERIERVAQQRGFGQFHHAAYFVACAYARMNKPDLAIRWLQETADTGLPCYPLFERDANLNPIRKDPRFSVFLARMKEQWQHYKTTLAP
jgi:TolB-like protein/DNA-binding winged helix-turn-helix (wHTH) protein/Tfp pilus assembly protein PilF